MKKHPKIDYGQVTSLDVLRALFRYRVGSLDFEFGDDGVPIAYGVATGSYARGFRLGNYLGNDQTKHLRAIGHKEFAMRLAKLVDQLGYKVFIVYGASDYHGLCKLYEKSYYQEILPKILICNVQPVLARQIKDGRISTHAAMIDAAYLMDVSLLGYQQHNPRDDARLLFEMAKQATRMTNSQYQAYLKALSQLRKRNINKVKAAYQELIADDGKRSIQNLQCCNDQLIAMKSELQHMKKLLLEIKKEQPTTRKHRKLFERKISQQRVSSAAPQLSDLHIVTTAVRPLFVDEVIFHYNKDIADKTPGAITIRHNNKTHQYFLFEAKSHKKERKKLGLEGAVFQLGELKTRYKTQSNQGKTIVLIVQRAQYDRATKIYFEQIMKEIIPSGNYDVCEV